MAEQDDESSPAPTPAAKKAKKAPAAAVPDAATAAVPDAATAAVPDAATAAVPDAVTAAVPDAVTAAVPDAVTAAVPDAVTAAVPDAAAKDAAAEISNEIETKAEVAAPAPAAAPAAIVPNAVLEHCDFVDPRQVRDFIKENHLAGTAEAPPGIAPRGPIRSLRRMDEGGTEQFVLIFAKANFLIKRAGVVGQRGTWTVVDYPSTSSASFAYARECSDLTSQGFRDVH
jgi:hypothetical protein